MLRDYMQLYLTTDVCLLADVVEHFRAICNKADQFGPAYIVSAPQLSWNAMLKKLRLEVKLISDPEKC